METHRGGLQEPGASCFQSDWILVDLGGGEVLGLFGVKDEEGEEDRLQELCFISHISAT